MMHVHDASNYYTNWFRFSGEQFFVTFIPPSNAEFLSIFCLGCKIHKNKIFDQLISFTDYYYWLQLISINILTRQTVEFIFDSEDKPAENVK